MRTKTKYHLIVWMSIFLCDLAYAQGRKDELQLLSDNIFHLSEVMLHDVANPPAAARFYSYAMLGAYETAYHAKGGIPDINKKLNKTPGIVAPEIPKNLNLSLCTNYALLE